MFTRSYNFIDDILIESFFLFGPRQTGKTTQLAKEFPKALVVDLLKPGVARELNAKPEHLSEMIRQYLAKSPQFPIVIIDEIQKIPTLLDVVQSEICEAEVNHSNLRFILTGSSMRRLLSAGQNLLGGRAGLRTFWPLSYIEATSDPKIAPTIGELVQWGGLPTVIKSAQRKAVLRRYIDVYIEIEIRAEGVTRNLPKFSRFLEIAALATGQQISMRGVASDVALSESTVTSWFGVLEDTLIGHLLPCYQETHKRKAMTSRKFYFFDCGISNAILNRFSLSEATPEFGVAMESYVFQNLKIYCAQNVRENLNLFYWRSVDHKEVDFILTLDGAPFWAIEVKSGERIKETDFLGIKAFEEEFPQIRKTLVARVATSSLRTDGIEVTPIEEFLRNLNL